MSKKVWLLLDNRMGSVGQARGVAQAMDKNIFEIEEKSISYNGFARLPNWLKGVSLIGVAENSRKEIKPPFPDVVISASRRTAPIARYIKRKSKGETKIIQLLHPGNSGLGDFDLLFLPEHDKDKKSTLRTIYTKGSPHRVTEVSLTEAREKWTKVFKDLPRPLTALIIGGSIGGKEFSMENAKKLAQEVKAFKNKIGGSLLTTNSKRTGKEPEKVIMSEIKNIPSYDYLWGNKGDNPYLGFLACADNIIVTGDSVSMCSEACGTGKPVFIFSGENWLTPKHYRFIQSLFDGGYATKLSSENSNFKSSGKLNPANEVAEKIKELF
ncbi:MAG: mitochondrial fission ELM1 family protein [Lactobacillaceae bacterium]|nr:mitochondrial fission ELM1 family protein [Lactobacillaceae bacterium]